MNRRKVLRPRGISRMRLLFLLILPAFLLSLVWSDAFNVKEGFAQEEAAKPSDQLANSDCVKCHSAVVGTVDAKGGKHKTAVGCIDCHQGHPPMVSKEGIIPVCGTCHSGKPHYQIGGCETCHTNPHAPVEMKLAANLTAPCLSCHALQGAEMKDHPSKHSKLFCTTCHKAHKDVPECLKCHQAHSTQMVNADCASCHPAHQPLTIAYAQDIPSKHCAACHATISTTLTSTQTKHSALQCAFCHKDRHKFVPACESCHGTPHPAPMLSKFPKCNMCHISAHSLGKEAQK